MPINMTSRSAALFRPAGVGSFSDFATTGLPAGVTLQVIDGGPTYYTSNSFTFAANAGWDNPSFFPIAVFFARCDDQTDADLYVDLNLNVLHTIFASTPRSLLLSNGIWALPQDDAINGWVSGEGALGNETIGIVAADEPSTYEDATDPIRNRANAQQDNRPWIENYTWNQIEFAGVDGHDMDDLLSELIATPNATTRHLDIQSVDIYWMAGAIGVGAFNGGSLYDKGSDLTADETRRACHYGDMVDRIRPYQSSNYPAPIFQFVENGGPYTEDTTAASYIQPPELDAAVWSSIIHGALGVIYFNHSFGGPSESQNNFADDYFQTIQSGQSISIYDQAKATNALVLTMAPIIKSPFAMGYVTVSPAGWKFGEIRTTYATSFSGFDVMAKYYNVSGGDNKFYIFAMPRYSGTTTNQTATFTIVNTGATQVTVINEARTISITSGTTFSDNFATGNTVHIYRVD